MCDSVLTKLNNLFESTVLLYRLNPLNPVYGLVLCVWQPLSQDSVDKHVVDIFRWAYVLKLVYT